MAAGIEIPTPVRKTGIETQLQRFPQAQTGTVDDVPHPFPRLSANLVESFGVNHSYLKFEVE